MTEAAGAIALVPTERFEAWSDPAGNWTVWDIGQDAPATLGRVPLLGLEEGLATALCQLMNEDNARAISVVLSDRSGCAVVNGRLHGRLDAVRKEHPSEAGRKSQTHDKA